MEHLDMNHSDQSDQSRINAQPVLSGTLKVEQSVDGPFEATSIRYDFTRGDLWFQGEYVDGLGKIQLITLVLPYTEGTFSGGFSPNAEGYYTRRANDTSQSWHSVSGDYKPTFLKRLEIWTESSTFWVLGQARRTGNLRVRSIFRLAP